MTERPTVEPETTYELIDQLQREKAELVAALEAVEWVCDAGLWYCPCCKQQRTKGHKTDCQLAAALAKAKGESL